MLARYRALGAGLSAVGASMQKAWYDAHHRLLDRLPPLAASAQAASTALERDLNDLRAYDSIRESQGALETLLVERCAGQLPSPLCTQVHDALVARGLRVHKQWGAGGHRLDLVLVDPRDPTRMAQGIECEGPSYHARSSVRERDLARRAFVEKRGWRIHSVWSSDWLRNPSLELQRILEAVEARV
jgi:very-short-patch-repair endonuclease